jgi:hypothetical protein
VFKGGVFVLMLKIHCWPVSGGCGAMELVVRGRAVAKSSSRAAKVGFQRCRLSMR